MSPNSQPPTWRVGENFSIFFFFSYCFFLDAHACFEIVKEVVGFSPETIPQIQGLQLEWYTHKENPFGTVLLFCSHITFFTSILE